MPEGISWSTTNANQALLLNVNLPIGLQFGANPEDVVVEGQSMYQAIASNIESTEQLPIAL